MNPEDTICPVMSKPCITDYEEKLFVVYCRQNCAYFALHPGAADNLDFLSDTPASGPIKKWSCANSNTIVWHDFL